MNINTLNLVGDGDEDDTLREVELLFGIQITEAEAIGLRTVGDLFDLVVRKAGPHQTRACLTQAAFHRLRRVLRDLGADEPIVPDTPIARALAGPVRRSSLRVVWRELGAAAGLKLPDREIRWPWSRDRLVAWTVSHRWLTFAAGTAMGILISPFVISTGISRFAAFCCLVAVVGLAIAANSVLRYVIGNVPVRVQTVGDLAREAAGRSFVSLRDEEGGFSPQDRWWALLAILRDISGHAGPIDRETTFFARMAVQQPA